MTKSPPNPFVIGPLIIFAILLLSVLLNSCTSIDTGEVGVVKHFGAVQPYVLDEGIHWLRPWASVTTIDTKLRTAVEEAHSASKDLQMVATKVTVQYSIASGGAPRLVQRFGGEEQLETNVLKPAIQESVKAVASRYTAEQLITHRAEVKTAIELVIQGFVDKTLKDKGASGAVRLANVAITNFDFSKEFNVAIEEKVRAEQDALKAENEKRKRVTVAEAEAAERRLSADSIAYKTEVESKARADAIQRESKALEQNPALVQLRIAEKWNGVLPTYTGDTVPMLQIR